MVTIRHAEPADYASVIGVIDDWWGGRAMAAMLPKLFFVHFRDPSFVAEEDPGAVLAPVVVPGFTDSHFMREAFGTACYGFFPMRTMVSELAARLIHSADERIPVEDLELGTRFLLHVVRTLEA